MEHAQELRGPGTTASAGQLKQCCCRSTQAGPLGALGQDRLPVPGPLAVHLPGSQKWVPQPVVANKALLSSALISHRALNRFSKCWM